MIRALRHWPLRRWLLAGVASAAAALALGLPTDVIPNPLFGRQGTPVPWFAVPVLVASSIIAGLLIATYLADDGLTDAHDEGPKRSGGIGGLLSFFAIGCPICNKLVVLALGTSGALSWFAPIQPWLGVASLLLLAWALRTRLRNETQCRLPVQTSPA